MPSLRTMSIAATAMLALAMQSPPASAQFSRTLYTTYNVGDNSISWVTCGSTNQDEGCYQSGGLGPFGRVCAVLTGATVKAANTLTQYLYILDSNYKKSGNVFLDVYKKEDVFTPSYITTTYTLTKSMGLSLTGGPGVACYAAANNVVIAAGTSASSQAVVIQKNTLAQAPFGGFSPPEMISSIVANGQGYISVNQGSGSATGFYLIGPDGNGVEDGGGTALLFGTQNAVTR